MEFQVNKKRVKRPSKMSKKARQAGKQMAHAVKRLESKPVMLDNVELVPVLLSSVAHGLNALEQHGVKVEFAHGALITDWGYVFRIGDEQAPWEMRTRSLTAVGKVPPPGDDD